MSEDYKPQAKTAAILRRALEMVGSVPYAVSARWLFYGLLQEGYYSSKEDYKNRFLPATSSARHAFWEGWAPDTLADDTREATIRGGGFDSPAAWLRAVQEGLDCNLDHWRGQDFYIELWHEARAMSAQFRHYTQSVTLDPMGGQPSIDSKWQAAKRLERAAERYALPIVVCYFGDLDRAGELISNVVERDVRKWCAVPFDFVRCGLTAEQVARYGVPENFEKPGEYQWEALSDDAAREIITASMAPFFSQDRISAINRRAYAATSWLRGELADLELPAELC